MSSHWDVGVLCSLERMLVEHFDRWDGSGLGSTAGSGYVGGMFGRYSVGILCFSFVLAVIYTVVI